MPKIRSASSFSPFAPVNGAQGRAPHAAQVGKAHEDGNDGQAQPQPGQGQVPRQPAQVHAVYNIIKDVDELRHRHGERHLKDVPRHARLGDLVGMVGESVVDAAAVDVQVLPRYFMEIQEHSMCQPG